MAQAIDLSCLKPDRRLALSGAAQGLLQRKAVIDANQAIEDGADALERMAMESGAIAGEFAVSVRVVGNRAVVQLGD